MNIPFIPPNKWYHRGINNATAWLILTTGRPVKGTVDPLNQHPLWISGFFRSGTSLMAHVLQEMGMDLGQSNHLVQARGRRKNFNPDGFFENYLFMDWSLYVFHKLNAWGHIPPEVDKVEKFTFDENSRKEFVRFSVCGVRDDRISNFQKMQVLKKYDHLNLPQYLATCFKSNFAIKNPHFSVLYPLLFKQWPQSHMLVCFRHPAAALASSVAITSTHKVDVYAKYYQGLVTLPDNRVTFISFENLAQHPEKSLNALAAKLNLDKNTIPRAMKIINPDKIKTSSLQLDVSSVLPLYNQLCQRAINA